MKIKNEIIIRKINSILVILIFALLLWHSLCSALYMLGIINYSPSMIKTGRRLFIFVMLHVILSLYLCIKDTLKRRNIKTFFKIQNETKLQIISGIIIGIFVFLHYISYATISMDSNISIIHFVIDNLLFISIIMHLSISIPRLLISLGFLTNDDEYNKFKKNIKHILLVVLIFFFLSETIYYIL